MRSSSEADRAEWDEIYGEHDDQMWSGRPNGSLVAEASKLAPGTALDVGCGEGADAMWLARQGWDAVGIDISPIAIERATAEAARAGLSVRFSAVDAIAAPPTAGSFDLVALSYPAFKRDRGLDACKAIVDAVAPGGRFLVVGHVMDDATRAQALEHGFDPDDYVSVDDLNALLKADFTIEVDDARDRPDPPPDAHHMRDRVVVAVRDTLDD